MARKFLSPIDLAKNELQNAKVQNLASAPSSPATGQAYFDTTLGKFGVYDGSEWDYMGTSEASGDVSSNTGTSVDSEVALFSGTGGKTIKRATGTGIAKLTSGVLSTATSGTDYAPATSGTSILKGDGSGGFSNASAGTDYLTGSSTNTLTNKTIDANGTGNSITNLETADFAANVIDTDVSLSAGSDTRLATQLAVRTYVNNSVQGLSWKQAVRAATTASGTLATAYENGDTIDGVTLATGDRILLKDQSSGSENGIYVVNASGAPTRASDANTGTELRAATVYVEEGTANADTVWNQTTNATITVGSTSLVFAQVNGGTVPSASTTVSGRVELADSTEAEARSSSSLATTPASLANFPVKKTFTIGDNSATSIAVTHNLGTKEVITQVRQASDDAVVECDIVNTSTTQVTLTFAVAPDTNAIKVVVLG